jgi:hypothetical protein
MERPLTRVTPCQSDAGDILDRIRQLYAIDVVPRGCARAAPGNAGSGRLKRDPPGSKAEVLEARYRVWTPPSSIPSSGRTGEVIRVSQWAEIRQMFLVDGVAKKEITRRFGVGGEMEAEALAEGLHLGRDAGVSSGARGDDDAGVVHQAAAGGTTEGRERPGQEALRIDSRRVSTA